MRSSWCLWVICLCPALLASDPNHCWAGPCNLQALQTGLLNAFDVKKEPFEAKDVRQSQPGHYAEITASGTRGVIDPNNEPHSGLAGNGLKLVGLP